MNTKQNSEILTKIDWKYKASHEIMADEEPKSITAKLKYLKDHIGVYQDFPKDGIVFRFVW